MKKLITKVRNQKSRAISHKAKSAKDYVVTTCVLSALVLIVANDANAAGTAVEIKFVDNLHATVKELMQGAGSFVIDAMILAGGGWATARTSTPAPIILAILSVFIFEICIKLIT
jgi:hypothetical protein